MAVGRWLGRYASSHIIPTPSSPTSTAQSSPRFQLVPSNITPEAFVGPPLDQRSSADNGRMEQRDRATEEQR
jgi:hypothetical protein